MTDKKPIDKAFDPEIFFFFFEESPVAMTYIGPDSRYRLANTAYQKMVKWSSPILEGTHIQDVLGENGFVLLKPRLEAALAGEKQQFEASFHLPDGSLHSFTATYLPHRVAQKTLGIYTVIEDITTRNTLTKERENLILELRQEIEERRRMETSLEEKDRLHRSIINTMTDALCITDTKGTILEANPSFCKIYGYSREELLGMAAPRLIHPDYHHVFTGFIEQVQSIGRFYGETVDIRKDGSFFDTEVRGTVFQYNGQNCLLAVIRDVSARKKAERDREQHVVALQNALNEIKTLRGIIPICSFCKKVRDDQGYWDQVEVYISERSDADFSHSVCPQCMKTHYPDL